VIQTGTLKSGTEAGLASNDNVTYQVNSTTNGNNRAAAWYGSFTAVPRPLQHLTVSYSGANSLSATEVIEIWDWTKKTWVAMDSRTVGTTEAISNLVPSGTVANYVSGTTASGEIRVRVRTTGGKTSFYTSADLLQLSYDKP